ncbi:uncharacterized protein MELLADRAFT_71402 [Melampsora larici-populina 98AG31]|uniref:Secreted protein n=3 Tax=Melampsora laricis-populina TaxID=203908 RepID=F4RFY2_MELLP|nr:uncharacterized protein MELLADRAFT_71402 [Melampsora larici-populina 98AG31]EGG08449.1 secreted protein [Melampsora larici-populina 98AG31]
MLSLVQRVALLAALSFMTLGQVYAHACGPQGTIKIQKKDCFSAMNRLPGTNGQISSKSNPLTAIYRTCKLVLSTEDPKQVIRATKAAIKDGINSDIDSCHGYTSVNLQDDKYPDLAVRMYVGAYNSDPSDETYTG